MSRYTIAALLGLDSNNEPPCAENFNLFGGEKSSHSLPNEENALEHEQKPIGTYYEFFFSFPYFFEYYISISIPSYYSIKLLASKVKML